MRKIFTFLLALAASVGMMNAKVTWNSSNVSDLSVYGTRESYSKEGVTLSANADMLDARWYNSGDESRSGIEFHANETGGFTFSNTLGKNFTKIVMTVNGPAGWDFSDLGSGWSFYWDFTENPATVTWTGNASTVDLLKEASDFGGEQVKSIVFYFVGDSEAPDPTYTIALEDGTVNADKVTLSATSAVEGATVTVTPNEEYEIKAFKATYNTTEEAASTLDPATGAYSFTMPAYDVTIEATIALKPVPEGDIFAGFTATAGSDGFDNEGSANLVDNKFISSNWTKWCTNDGHKSLPTGESESCWWIDFEAGAALNVTGYILTTGNDTGSEHGRNPKNWLLKAKLNADDAWTTIATVTNDVTMKNKSFKDYKFFVDQSGSYKYFRFEVFANQGADVMQLCELRLIGTEASDPTPEPQPAGPIPCTAADLGKVLCTDGSIYATVSDATAASKTAAAVITYVDTENNKGLALALANESGTRTWEMAKTTAAAHTPAVSGGTWTLASKDDWDHMINAAGGYNALRDCFSGVGGTNIQKGQYWTSTEYDSGTSLVLNFGTNDGGYFVALYEDPYSVRACLAFDISAAPAPTVWTALKVGDVIKLGDKIEVPAEGDGWGINGNILRNAWGPYTLIRANIVQEHEYDDPEVTEAEDGAYYVFKAENDDFYPLSNLGKGTGLVVTTTSDGLVVTNVGDLGMPVFTVAVHENGGAPTGVENVQGNVRATKVIENGVLYILHNGTMYNVQGTRVR